MPGRGDFLADPRQRGALFVGRAGRIEPLHEQAADHLFLFEQRAPRCFSRMRGKYGLDPESLEQSRDLRRCDIRRGQTTRGGLQTAFLRIAGATQIVAAAPDAMNSLGEVDDLEVGGERADECFGIARRQGPHQRVQLVIRRRDRGLAGALDELEETIATLLTQNVSDECAECAHVVPERDVLWSKLCQEASAGVKRRAAPTPHAARSSDARPSLLTGIASPFCSTRLVRRASLNA